MKFIKTIFKLSFLIFLIPILINIYVILFTNKYIYKNEANLPKTYTGIVLGAYVWNNNRPSYVLRARLNGAIRLYNAQKIDKFLLSGDNGQKDYDEVNVMKNYLLDNGIPEDVIFLDHAGFDTYSTMVRANKIFEVTDVIVITQDFHINRAVYLARKNGIEAYGYSIASTTPHQIYIQSWLRDKLATIKAFSNVLTKRTPKYLGDKIPITGDNKKSWD